MRRLPGVVTGGVATGKTTVLDRFRWHGLAVASADNVVGEIWSDEKEARPLATELGVGFPADRDDLRARLSDPAFRARMANALHRRVMDKLFASGAQVVEIPLLCEGCLQGVAEVVVVVSCSPETQLRRLTQRLGDQLQAEQLIATQLSTPVTL